jgi:hypothetical protein
MREAAALAPPASFVAAPTPLLRTRVQAKRAFADAVSHRESPALRAQPVASAPAALAEAAAGAGETSEAAMTRGEDRFVLLGFLALFLLVGAFVLWALLSGDGVLDARG